MRRPSSPYASSFSFGPGPVSTTLKALIAANVVMFLVTTFAQSVIPYLGLVPAFVLRLAMGELADGLLLSGQRAIPARAQALGFRFRYETAEAALRQVLGAPR